MASTGHIQLSLSARLGSISSTLVPLALITLAKATTKATAFILQAAENLLGSFVAQHLALDVAKLVLPELAVVVVVMNINPLILARASALVPMSALLTLDGMAVTLALLSDLHVASDKGPHVPQKKSFTASRDSLTACAFLASHSALHEVASIDGKLAIRPFACNVEHLPQKRQTL